MTHLLDSGVAIDLRDNRGDTAIRVASLPVRPFLSVISKVELEGGVYARPDLMDRRRRALDAVLRRLTVLDFDAAMASIYGRIVAQAGFSRRKIIDRMIAATALVHDLTLITTNPADFADIDGLKLEAWNP